jgi:hypothetical protein
LKGKEHLREILGSPYESCFQWWLSTALEEHRRYGSTEPIAVIHEENQFEAQARRAYNYIRETQPCPLVSLTFGSKREFVPLQAADILAYDVGKLLLNQNGRPRRSFEALTPEGRKPRIRFYDRENMADLISKMEAWHASSEQERQAMFAAARGQSS